MNQSRPHPRILVVEDQLAMRQLLAEYLEQNDFEVETCESADVALQKLGVDVTPDEDANFAFAKTPGETNGNQKQEGESAAGFDLVLTDVKMPGMDGLEFCRQLNEHRPDLPVIVMTAYGSMETSIEALRAGAFDFVTKPVELELLKASLSRATENSFLRRYVRQLESTVTGDRFNELIGESDCMLRLKDQLLRVAD